MWFKSWSSSQYNCEHIYFFCIVQLLITLSLTLFLFFHFFSLFLFFQLFSFLSPPFYHSRISPMHSSYVIYVQDKKQCLSILSFFLTLFFFFHLFKHFSFSFKQRPWSWPCLAFGVDRPFLPCLCTGADYHLPLFTLFFHLFNTFFFFHILLHFSYSFTFLTLCFSFTFYLNFKLSPCLVQPCHCYGCSFFYLFIK